MIYLDNAATTRIDGAVLNAMMPYLREYYGNAGSLHYMGRKAYNAIQKARKQVADFIGASPEQIIFTSGGTEANNMIIQNANAYKDFICNPIRITSVAEHDSILNTFAPEPFSRELIEVRSNGEVDMLHFLNAIDRFKDDSCLVSIMHTNNELGVENPIDDIGAICRLRGIPFHTDCVQAAGYSKLDVEKFNCDFLTISSHKIHGPKGVGALYIREPEEFIPLIWGGEAQEFGLRGGTENVPGIVGFGEACEIAMNNLSENRYIIDRCITVFCSELRYNMLVLGLNGILHTNSDAGKIVNVRFDGVKSESLLMMLDSQGVCVSAGSACNASDGKPSHVLKAIGLSDEEARSSIRVSFSRMNTVEESAKAAGIVANCVKTLKEMS